MVYNKIVDMSTILLYGGFYDTAFWKIHLKYYTGIQIHNQNQSYILQKVLVNYFGDVLKDTSKKERYQVYYHIGGIYNFTICWIENDMKDQPECLAKIGADITSNIEPYLLK